MRHGVAVVPWQGSVNSTGQIQSATLFGPAVAPTGSCPTNGQWVLSQDGSITQCASGTWTSFSAASGVASINTVAGSFTFTGPGVSCSSTNCVFTGTGTGIGSITWSIPSWLTASPNPITTSGTQTISAATGQTSHKVIGTCGTATSFGPCSLVAGDIPTLNQNTTGTAAGLSGTPALPNGTTATTQTTGDNTTKIATDAFVIANAGTATGNMNDGSGTTSVGDFPETTSTGHDYSLNTPATVLSQIGAAASGSTTGINGTSCALNGTCSPPAQGGVVTSSSCTMGGTYNSGVYFNQNSTTTQAVTCTLPAPSFGKLFCLKNFVNSSNAADTGTLELLVANTGTQVIVWNGATSASGYVQSTGAAGDYGCVFGVSSTQWDFTPSTGNWNLH